MESLILVLHVIVCVLLVILVLLQSGKEGMGVIFGGGNTSVFGSSGAGSLLAKMTAFVAVIFVITSLAYTYVTSEHVSDDSAVLNVRIEDPSTGGAPAAQAPAESSVIPSAASPAITRAAPALRSGVFTCAPVKRSTPVITATFPSTFTDAPIRMSSST